MRPPYQAKPLTIEDAEKMEQSIKTTKRVGTIVMIAPIPIYLLIGTATDISTREGVYGIVRASAFGLTMRGYWGWQQRQINSAKEEISYATQHGTTHGWKKSGSRFRKQKDT